jgi:hypothetical protein
MKTAISIPDPIFEQAEEAAKELRMSRSELYTTALREFLQEQQTAQVIERLNQVYAEEPSNLDPGLNVLCSEKFFATLPDYQPNLACAPEPQRYGRGCRQARYHPRHVTSRTLSAVTATRRNFRPTPVICS